MSPKNILNGEIIGVRRRGRPKNDGYKMFGMILILWEWLDGGRRPGIEIYGGEL